MEDDTNQKNAISIVYPLENLYFCSIIINRKEENNMAKPIKETPILFGEDARKFEKAMKNPRKETPDERKRRLEHYQAVMSVFKG